MNDDVTAGTSTTPFINPFLISGSSSSVTELFYYSSQSDSEDTRFLSLWDLVLEERVKTREEMFKQNPDWTVKPIPKPQKVRRLNSKRRRRYNYFGVV